MSAGKPGQELTVLGAGLAGLSAAYHAGPQAVLYEAESRPGGECVTDYIFKYAFDRSGHLLHLRTPEIKDLIQRLLPRRFALIHRDARVHILDKEVRYPIQSNLHGLPTETKAEALLSYLEAVNKSKPRPAGNFLAWTQMMFGSRISQMFFEPYNRKLWTEEPARLTLEWMRDYIPKPEIARVIRGAFSDIAQGGGYNATFLYPKKGGIDCIAKALAGRVPGMHLNARVARIDNRQRTLDIHGRGRVKWKKLVSTLPLPLLVSILQPVPGQVKEAARKLRANSVLVVNLGVKRPRLHTAHWLYFPEEKYSFYRVGFPSNFGKVAPRDRSTLYAEVALKAGTGWDQREELVRRVSRDLKAAGILQAEDKIEITHLQYLPYAYVIYDRNYAQARKTILTFLEKVGILSIGRWGHWEYSTMEDALLAGQAAAKI